MKRLKLLNDFVFKKTFGEEDSKESLISLLNAILDRKDRDQLVTLEIVNNKELTAELINDKAGRIDVRAKTGDGTQIDIEVQLANQYNMEKRTLWYWGRLFNEGIKKGQDYSNLSKVITINILDFDYINIEDKYHTTFHLREDEIKDYMLTDLIEIHFIEMKKFKNVANKNLQEDKLQRWLTFLREDISEEELKELMAMDVEIRKAEERVEYLSSDPDTIELYRAREEALHERANMINGAREEGIKEVAKNMLRENIPVDVITKMTGLTAEVVNKLMC